MKDLLYSTRGSLPGMAANADGMHRNRPAAGLTLVATLILLCGSQVHAYCRGKVTDTSGCPAGAPAVAQLQSFWSEFRSAVLSNDQHKIIQMTRFPFRTRGTLDTDPTKAYDRKAFAAIFNQLLDEDAGTGPNPKPMRDLVRETPVVNVRMLGDCGHAAHIGSFEFRSIDGRWKFTHAWLNSD
jgi:hypothetical protein